MEGIHQVYDRFGDLGAVAEIIFGEEGAVLGRFHDASAAFSPRPSMLFKEGMILSPTIWKLLDWA